MQGRLSGIVSKKLSSRWPYLLLAGISAKYAWSIDLTLYEHPYIKEKENSEERTGVEIETRESQMLNMKKGYHDIVETETEPVVVLKENDEKETIEDLENGKLENEEESDQDLGSGKEKLEEISEDVNEGLAKTTVEDIENFPKVKLIKKTVEKSLKEIIFNILESKRVQDAGINFLLEVVKDKKTIDAVLELLLYAIRDDVFLEEAKWLGNDYLFTAF